MIVSTAATTTTTSFCPTSFQLKLALGPRKPPSVAFVRTRRQYELRRLSSVVVRSSVVNGDGVEQRSSKDATWNSLNSKTDGFAGWSNGDGERQLTDDSKRKQSLLGMVGAGTAGILLVAGLTSAALSFSKRSSSRGIPQMEPLTPQHEKLMYPDDYQEQVKEEKSDENIKTTERSSEDSKTGTDKNLYFLEETIKVDESRTSDGAGAGQTSKEEGGFTDNFPPSKAVERESDISDGLISPEKSPISDITDGTLGVANIEWGRDGINAEDANELVADKPTDLKISDSSKSNSFSENLFADLPKEFSGSNEPNKSSLSPDAAYVEPPVSDFSVVSESYSASKTNFIQKDLMDSERVLLTEDGEPRSYLLEADVVTKKLEEGSADGENKSSGVILNGASLMPDVPYQSGIDSVENDYDSIGVSRSLYESSNTGNFFTSAGVPAPSVVSAALQAPPGKVLVPAVVDQLQSQALSALQVLKVIEDDVQPGDLCTRREYARWLVVASSALSRNVTSKVYPAMYIENVSELAFDDITPEDPDFPSIQGLAEAGLIASKLSRHDMQSSDVDDSSPLLFSPESPLSRQDLVSWKMALDKRQLPEVDKKTLHQLTGFIDIEKIHPDAWPALVADSGAEEQGIITLAFGYTRLFQPEKPVTKAQAAIALSTGDASATVSEELARIEAESMAENAVSAHSALVAQVEKDLNANYEKELSIEREKINAIEKLAEEARREVEKLRTEREEANLSLMKERAAVDSEMEVLTRLKRDVEEQLQTLMADKLEASYEKERLNKLRKDAEAENQEVARLQYELEVERKALSMARAWAEDEAKRAREHAKALEEARDRWESKGIKVVVDNDLREEAEAAETWVAAAGKQYSVEETVERSENLVTKLKKMADQVRGRFRDTINKVIDKIASFISNLKQKMSEVKNAAKSKFDSSLQGVQRSSGEITFSVKESAKRVVGDWKEGVERLSQRFKT